MTKKMKHTRDSRFANWVLLATALWCVVLAVIFYLIKPPAAAMKYQIALGIMGGGSLLLRRLGPEVKERVALSIVSAAMCLILIEVFLFARLHGAVPDRNIQLAHRVSLAESEGRAFDTRNAFQVVQDLRAEGVDAFPNVPPSIFIETDGLALDTNEADIFPFGSLSDRTNVFCNEDGTWGIYETDERGFNNPRGTLTSGKADVVAIGDSFAQGACVGAGEDISSQLRILREGETIVNLGAYGSGPLLELAILKEYAKPLRPRTVLWMFFEHNDLTERGVLREVTSPTLMRYLEEPDFSQGLFDRQREIDSLLSLYVTRAAADYVAGEEQAGEEVLELAPRTSAMSMLWFEHLRMGLSELRDRLSLRGHRWGDRNRTGLPRHEWLRRSLVEAQRAVDSWGGELYFVYVPAWKRYTRFVNHDNLYDRARVLAVVAELGLPVIDLHEPFSKHEDPMSLFPLRIHGHYTAEGYALAAQYVDERINEIEAIH